MNILHLDSANYSELSLKKLNKFNLISQNFTDQKSLIKFLEKKSFDAIFTKLGFKFDEGIMELQNKLRYIITPTTGLNHIDLNECLKRNIEVISLKNEADFLDSITSTAELTWALLLALERRIIPAFNSVRSNKWQREQFIGNELNGKTIGILGFGRLGKIVYRFAKSFNMKVLSNDVDPEKFNGYTELEIVDFDELFKRSDIVVVLVSWKIENNHLINSKNFELMKPGSVFINTARGELVDEIALLSALKNKKLKGAALDVMENDSIWSSDDIVKNELIEYAKRNDNLIITPHIGGYADEAIKKTRDFVTDKFLKLIN